MTAQVALLRGVNVGGRRRVAMSELRSCLVKLGLEDVRTLLQSGSVVFRSHGQSGAVLERFLELEVEKCLGLRTDFIVRSASELSSILQRNPFNDQAKRDPSHLIVFFLKHAPAGQAVEALRESIRGPEILEARGKEVYIVYPAGIARSRLTIDVIEGQLTSRGSGRNWNTVSKLATLAGEMPVRGRGSARP